PAYPAVVLVLVAEFPVIVLFWTVMVPPTVPRRPIPPPDGATLLAIVELRIVNPPAATVPVNPIPPPPVVAPLVFPETVLFSRSRNPPLAKLIPPPLLDVE